MQNTLSFFRVYPSAVPPRTMYAASAGWDLSACIFNDAGRPMTRTLAPRMTTRIKTGLVLRPPDGYCILICSRSGLAQRSIFVANAPGVIDPDYTGETEILLYNGGLEAHYVQNGDRIAQAILLPISRFEADEIFSLPKTERGARGFGSTGD